jgi:hypothetical protein
MLTSSHASDSTHEEATSWAVGGILQCYLDCDQKKIGFGYNGSLLGIL